jgi:transposase
MPDAQYAGIDVSQERLDVAVMPAGERAQFANSEVGRGGLVLWLRERGVVRVVLEATGHLELDAALAIDQAGMTVCIVNPRQARRFAEATGRLEKSDSIDAMVLALFAQTVPLKPTRLPDTQQQLIMGLVARRRQLTEMLVAETNRLQSCRSGQAKKSIEATIRFLRRQLKQVDKDLDKQVRSSPLWKEDVELLKSVPGVGRITASTLIAELPEIRQLNERQLAKLVGVAPLVHQSGKERGKSTIYGGRAHVRATLYMATLSATRHNPTIRAYYSRLLARGKEKKVALVACMHKLLDILHSILHKRQPWREAIDLA